MLKTLLVAVGIGAVVISGYEIYENIKKLKEHKKEVEAKNDFDQDVIELTIKNQRIATPEQRSEAYTMMINLRDNISFACTMKKYDKAVKEFKRFKEILTFDTPDAITALIYNFTEKRKLDLIRAEKELDHEFEIDKLAVITNAISKFSNNRPKPQPE